MIHQPIISFQINLSKTSSSLQQKVRIAKYPVFIPTNFFKNHFFFFANFLSFKTFEDFVFLLFDLPFKTFFFTAIFLEAGFFIAALFLAEAFFFTIIIFYLFKKKFTQQTGLGAKVPQANADSNSSPISKL